MGKHQVPLSEYEAFYNVFARKFYNDETKQDILPKGKQFWQDNKEAILKIFDGTKLNPYYLFDVFYRKVADDPEKRSIDVGVLLKCLDYLGVILPEIYQRKNLEQSEIARIRWDELQESIRKKNNPIQSEGQTDEIPPYYDQIYNRIYWFYKDLEAADSTHLFENLMSPNFRYRSTIEGNIEEYREVLLFGVKVQFSGGLAYKQWRHDLVEAEVVMARYVETKLNEELVGNEAIFTEENSIVTYKKELLYRLYNFTFICINDYWFIEDVGSHKVLRGDDLYRISDA